MQGDTVAPAFRLANRSSRWRAVSAFAALCATAWALKSSGRRRAPSFRNRVVLITGGSRGLGFALARCFAREGARVALLARSADELDAAAAKLRQEWRADVTTHVCDVRDESAINRAVLDVVALAGGLDVLVNNAGVIQVTPFIHAQREDFLDSLATHFWGPYHLARACLPHLAASSGRIVNIASVGGRVAVPHLLPYSVGKFALVGLSEGLHAELAQLGVSVTTVSPYLMRTGSHRNVLVRGKHRAEATWFALATATRLTALDAGSAARSIVEAARARRASIAVGWQARGATIAAALAPESAAKAGVVATWFLPGVTGPRGDNGYRSRDLSLGAVSRLFASEQGAELNQPLPAEET